MLSEPFSTIVPGARGRVLSVLALTETPLTGRTIASLVQPRASLRTVQVALDDLALNGVAHRERAGRAYLYTLNRKHLTAPAVLALANLRQELLDRIRDETSSWKVPADALWMFGSAARGDGGPNSDIDLLILRPNSVNESNRAWLLQIEELTTNIYEWTGNSCEVLELSLTDLKAAIDRNDRLIADLRQDSIHLAGRTPRETLPRTVTR